MSFQNSICSYPVRGNYGSNKYRGNCCGEIIKDFLESYHHNKSLLFADPAVGSGTSRDVAKALGIHFKGGDLHTNFNLLTEDFGSFLGEEAHSVFYHPPYWNMIAYSGNQWGKEPNPWDMSRMDSLEVFVQALELAIMNIHDAIDKNGVYGILMGNLRREGNYFNLSSLVERLAPGKLVDEIIKAQHNCVSNATNYANNNLVRIAHEKLLIFRKQQSSLLILLKCANRTKVSNEVTWKAAVRRVVQALNGSKQNVCLEQIYAKIKPFAINSKQTNQHWQAKVRQCLQDGQYFLRISTGVYRLLA